ncbi:hypothetical protein ALC62_08749, partial [Cyphomyrmex costatus]
VKARNMLNELLYGYSSPLAVLFAVLPFLKSGNIPRWVIQVIIGSVEAFPKDRISFEIIKSIPHKLFMYRSGGGVVGIDSLSHERDPLFLSWTFESAASDLFLYLPFSFPSLFRSSSYSLVSL